MKQQTEQPLTKWATQTKDRAFEMADAADSRLDMPSLIGNAMADENANTTSMNMVSTDEGTVLDSFVAEEIPDFSFDETADRTPDKKSMPESTFIGEPYKAILILLGTRLLVEMQNL